MLAWLTLATGVLGLAFAVGVPLFQNPDEPSHVDRVRHQADHPLDLPDAGLRMRRSVVKTSEAVGLPMRYHQGWPGDLTGPRPDFPGFSEGIGPDRPACPDCQSYQYAPPPAYSLLLAPVSAVLEPAPADLHVLGLRVTGVLLALPLPFLTWWLAIEATRRSAVALAAAALAALNGPVVAATAAVNNDALAFTASAAVLALAATILRDGPSTARAVGLGAAMSVAGLTKVTALPVVLVGGLVLLLAGRRHLGPAVAGLVASVPGALWWLRNLVVDGRLTPGGTELFDATGPPTAGTESLAGYVSEHLGLLLHRALGLYGWAQALVPAWVAWAALVGTAGLALGWARAADRASAWPSRRLLVLVLAPVASVAATVASSYGNHQRTGAVTGLAGRYLYPSAPMIWLAVAAALASVLARWAPGALRWAPAGTVAAAAVAGLASLVACLNGLYGTAGIRTFLDRAELVAPVAPAGAIVAGLAVATVAAAGLAALAARPGPEPSG